MRRPKLKPVVVLAFGVAAALAGASCADSEAVVVREAPVVDEAGTTARFDPPAIDGGGDADTSVAAPLLLCMGTECPAPYATCPAPAGQLAYKCQIDLSTDDANCGACGNLCPSIPPLNVKSKCIGGKCVPFCADDTARDCNGIIEDGCETYVHNNPDNCGKCGNKCPDGVKCIDGNCGCPPGKTECHGNCIDTKKSDSNCGACDNVCYPPDGKAPPPNTEYGCNDSKCEQLRCVQNNQVHWENCDGDITKNGCEIDLLKLDPNNCGQCGNKCAANETCQKFADGSIACSCDKNETLCSTAYGPLCLDTSSNVEHCGACNHTCPFSLLGSKPHQFAACTDGLCGLTCEPGWGDCNGNTADGCETNLLTHGGNCGACGNACNTAAGQPCVNGACLMVECDAGVPK